MHHHHINREERVALAAFLREGYTDADIARSLGVHRSTIGRELKRNPLLDGYHATHADKLARERRCLSKKGARCLENDEQLATLVEALLHPLISPKVIAHLLGITHETIYAWLDRSRPDLKERLPRRGKKRRRYGSKRQAKQGWTRLVRPIDNRPSIVDERGRVGDFEGDTVRGKNGNILTHTDRMSRYEILHKISNEGCDAIHAAIKGDELLKSAETITYDRGSGFAIWRMIERDTGATVFFAHPHAPWERGTNENSNERVRRVYEKGSDLGMVSQEELDEVADFMNHTPRECLDWRTPCAVFKKACCVSN